MGRIIRGYEWYLAISFSQSFRVLQSIKKIQVFHCIEHMDCGYVVHVVPVLEVCYFVSTNGQL